MPFFRFIATFFMGIFCILALALTLESRALPLPFPKPAWPFFLLHPHVAHILFLLSFTGWARALAALCGLSWLAFTATFSAHYFFFFLETAALSTRLGYGRPAALALALAWAFFLGERALSFPVGSFLSQNALAIFLMPFLCSGHTLPYGLSASLFG